MLFLFKKWFLQEIQDENDLFAVSESETFLKSGKTVKIENNDDPQATKYSWEFDSEGDSEVSEGDTSTEDEQNNDIIKSGQSKKPWTKEKRRIYDLKLKCAQCDRMFMRHSDMKRHIKFHMGGIHYKETAITRRYFRRKEGRR